METLSDGGMTGGWVAELEGGVACWLADSAPLTDSSQLMRLRVPAAGREGRLASHPAVSLSQTEWEPFLTNTPHTSVSTEQF